MAEAFKACRAASQSISVASNGGRGSQEAADACSPRRRAIRRRHSAVDEGRGGRVVARHIHPETLCKAPPEHCVLVHQPTVQVCKPGESLALRKVKHPHNGRTSMNRLPLTKQDILSQYSGCFEGIGCFPGDPYKFCLKPEYKPAHHAPRKVQIHLESAFKEEMESLVKQKILEEVMEHTD